MDSIKNLKQQTNYTDTKQMSTYIIKENKQLFIATIIKQHSRNQ